MAPESAYQPQAAAPQPQTAGTTTRAEVTLRNPHGLHLRLAAELVKLCRNYDARLTLATPKGRSADARSPLALLTLAAPCGTRLVATATGPDAASMLKAVVAFFSRPAE